MKPTALLVNTSRAPLIEPGALVAGAAGRPSRHGRGRRLRGGAGARHRASAAQHGQRRLHAAHRLRDARGVRDSSSPTSSTRSWPTRPASRSTSSTRTCWPARAADRDPVGVDVDIVRRAMLTTAHNRQQDCSGAFDPACVGDWRGKDHRLYLCEALLKHDHEVLCVDNFFTGTRGNVAHLLTEPSFELIRHDVTFPLYVEVDEIYNLACPASPIHYQFDPVQTTKTSVLAPSTCSGWPRGDAQKSCRHPLRRCMVIRWCIRSPKSTGATSIRSARVPAMMKASVARRRCSSTTTVSIACGSRWYASSTLTARACIRTTDAWSRISSCRR